MGLRSPVNDLLTWSQALLTDLTDQRRSGEPAAKRSPPENPPDNHARQIPAHVLLLQRNGNGVHGDDASKLAKRRRAQSRCLLIRCQKLYTTSLILLPDKQSAIVMLANSIAPNKGSGLDYATLSRASADAQIAGFPLMEEKLEKNRTPNTNPGHSLDTRGLRKHQSWPLSHYHYTTFSWLMDRDKCVKRARLTVASESLYLFEFVEEERAIVALRWKHEAGVEPEFHRGQSDTDREDYGSQIILGEL
ncbi:hypothetical protein BDV12DRAFT_194175 [Aspergillus spectabilis]